MLPCPNSPVIKYRNNPSNESAHLVLATTDTKLPKLTLLNLKQ